jgi:endonuclease/exonuclease/phosphatase family metal-dependent hydrolase
MRTDTTALAHVLLDLDLDVVALQEVKLWPSAVAGCVASLNAAVREQAGAWGRQHGGYSYHAAPNAMEPGSEGVMLLWRSDLQMEVALEPRRALAAGRGPGSGAPCCACPLLPPLRRRRQ